MEFSKEQKKEAYMKLSEKERDFVSSDIMTDIYGDIAMHNSLMLDAVDKISSNVFLALIGLIKTSDIRDRLKKDLNLPDSKLDAILKEASDKIFIPFRFVLAEEAAPEKPETSEEAPVEEAPEMSKEAILSEIENPTPVVHPISVAQPTLAPKAAVAQDFIAGKLTETVNLPTQKVVVPPPSAAKPTYKADPYREQI